MEGTTASERKELAKKGAAARWSGEIRQATHGDPDHPLKIGDIEIPCYVLEDETRVLSQRGVVVSGLGIQYSGKASRGGADRLTTFLQGNALSPFVSSDLLALVQNPIRFSSPGGLDPANCSSLLRCRIGRPRLSGRSIMSPYPSYMVPF